MGEKRDGSDFLNLILSLAKVNTQFLCRLKKWDAAMFVLLRPRLRRASTAARNRDNLFTAAVFQVAKSFLGFWNQDMIFTCTNTKTRFHALFGVSGMSFNIKTYIFLSSTVLFIWTTLWDLLFLMLRVAEFSIFNRIFDSKLTQSGNTTVVANVWCYERFSSKAML